MKTIITLAISLNMIMMVVAGQTSDTLRRCRYGLEFSQFITGSGFASGSEMYLTIIPDQKKSLSFGVFFCTEQKKIAGVTMHHEVALLRNPYQKRAVPYAFYNMIYRFTRTRVNNSDKADDVEPGLYKSFEHHLGLGLNVAMAKNLHIKGAIGYGVYLGSIKKSSATDPITGEAVGSNGFGAIAKIGVSYVF